MNDVAASLTHSNKLAMLVDYEKIQAELARVKAAEAEMRKSIIAAFSDHIEDNFSGTENVDIGGGYDLKIEHKLDYKLDNANDYEGVDKIIAEMDDDPRMELIVDRLFKRKLEIGVTEYKNLPAEWKVKVDRVLTIKPAAKSVKFHKRAK